MPVPAAWVTRRALFRSVGIAFTVVKAEPVPRYTNVFTRRFRRDADRYDFANFINAIPIRASTALAPLNVPSLQAFGQLFNFSMRLLALQFLLRDHS